MASTQSLGPVVVSFSRLDSKRGDAVIGGITTIYKGKEHVGRCMEARWRQNF